MPTAVVSCKQDIELKISWIHTAVMKGPTTNTTGRLLFTTVLPEQKPAIVGNRHQIPQPNITGSQMKDNQVPVKIFGGR